jgi:hypothetical protein
MRKVWPITMNTRTKYPRYLVTHMTEETSCQQCGQPLTIGDIIHTDGPAETWTACSTVCAQKLDRPQP